MFWNLIESYGKNPALVSGTSVTTYSELAQQADDWAADIAARLHRDVARPLVLLQSCNKVAAVVAYLGALRAGWPVILGSASECAPDSQLRSTFAPNVILREEDGALACDVLAAPQFEMVEGLAVLLSTSGTTGAAKMVRLSQTNIDANANSIAQYLGAQAGDTAITTLPWHYSYGMSVLNVQLATGGALVLTDDAITDQPFWQTARQHAVTSLSLVPVQFDMLPETAALKDRLPSLRYLTQAGGRLDPSLGRRFHREGRRDGWRFFVMYGQTEAAPRISYVPPEAAEGDIQTIGQPVPGGQITLVDAQGAEITTPGTQGELVYSGPNVMMGYATSIEELADPAGEPILRTGDIAVRQNNGFFKIVGRAARFIKVNGLRLSLDEIEARLGRRGLKAYCSGSDAQLVVFAMDGAKADYRDELSNGLGLSEAAYTIEDLAEVPLNTNGKVNYKALKARADELTTAAPTPIDDDLETLLERVLRTETVDGSKSFVDHGGDSLSFLEIQLHFQRRGLALPPSWETLPLSRVIAAAQARNPSGKAVFVPVAGEVFWRIASITAVIFHHTTPWKVSGGAYLMLVFAGLSLARFQSGNLFAGRIGAALKTMLLPILIGYFAILLMVHTLQKPVDLEWFLLVGNFDPDINPRGIEPYWFVGAYAQLILVACVPFLFASVRKAVAREPLFFGLAALMFVFAAVETLRLSDVIAGMRIRHTFGGLELFLVGWCVHFARTTRQRGILLVALIAVFLRHWSGIPLSAAIFIYLGVSTSLVRLHIPVPTGLANAALSMASLTMFTYLIHPIAQSVIEPMNMPLGLLGLTVTIASFVAATCIKALIDRLSMVHLRQVA